MCTQTFRFANILTIVLATSLFTGCGVIGANLLDQYWLGQLDEDLNALEEDIQAGLDRPGTPGPQGDPGQPGADGEDGVSCWDLNGNGVADLDSEDINEDGKVDVEDCRGADGQDGHNGQDGQNGSDGKDGEDGEDGNDGDDGDPGLACWDLNGNGVADLETEDINNDGKVDADDCQGAQGEPGDPGVLAKARISAAGNIETNGPSFVIESERLQTGLYRVKIQIRDGIKLDNVEMEDFPVNVTPHPVFLYPGQPAERLFIAGQAWELDKNARTLEFRVHIQSLEPPQGYRNAAFTIVVLEP